MTDIRHGLLEDLQQFFKQYYREEIAELAQEYPKDSESFWVDHREMYSALPDVANKLLENPEQVIEHMQEAIDMVDIPVQCDLSDVDVRIRNLNENHVYAPGEIRKDQGQRYIGVTGVLERVTSTSDLPEKVAYQCQRCGTETTIPQTLSTGQLQEPHECRGCERQGPFEINHDGSDWSDYAKLRIESRPDVDESDSGKVVGFALNDLIDQGGDSGLIGRAGEPVTVYGILKRQQKTGRGQNELLFDHILDARAIEFEKDAETVDVDEHRDEFEQLAAQPDAVDKFASSIAPQLHETDAWETAMEFAVAYLFGAPRIDLIDGPTYRGDLHMLVVSDYGMGKSTFKEELEAYSPKCISKSTTALSSGVGLTAAAVKDDFGEGQWTLKPGLLVRANNGHLLLDEIDKGPDELTAMNDAIEGEQVVDIEKAGKSATYDSKTAVAAFGNPVDGRFNEHDSISEQLGMSETLLSRFDAIVTMQDSEDKEQDRRVAETYGKSFTEAQKAEIEGQGEFDALEREVPIDVGRAWVKYARENVNPILSYEQFQELEDWYADEVRQLNSVFADAGDGEDMPVPVTVRVLGAVTKMSIAYARANLEEYVQPEHIERAKRLGKRLVKQNWDGEKFSVTTNRHGPSDTEARKQVMDALTDEWQYPSDIAKQTGVSESKVRNRLKKLATETNPAKALEDQGRYKLN
jgi:replicative DNA helicase Mcm